MDFELKNILFLDIETISAEENFDRLEPRFQSIWIKKAQKLKNEVNEPLEELYAKRAAIYSEFGKVLCIGIGGYYDFPQLKFKAKTLINTNEKELLLAFKLILEEHPAKSNLVLCAHNGKEFDFPYLCRRMLINGIQLPAVLNISFKKPWEIKHLDTLEFWKFGDYKNYTSLETLATVFEIPTSKNDIDGSEVNNTFYKENDLEKISIYCREDVVVLSQLFLKMNGQDILAEENIFRH